jgi:hypothetical protein
VVKDLERAFANGTLFHGGQEFALDGTADLKQMVQTALTAIIPNVYTRFSIADKEFDFARQLKALLNPATKKLHEVAPALGLFDTQGSLQRDAALPAQILEVLADLEDEGTTTDGAHLLDARDEKKFRGFVRAPYGWPDELVRLVIAACFRGGVIYLESQTPAGPSPQYDYKGTDDLFAKITAFKRTTFKCAGVGPTIDELKRASKALIAMGMQGTPESANAIAAAIRTLGLELETRLQDARSRAEQGLPIPDAVLNAQAALAEPTTAKDPSTVVKTFLSREDEWKAASKGLKALADFVQANRYQEYGASQRLLGLARIHPIPAGDPKGEAFAEAEKDLETIVSERAVIARWADYQTVFDTAYCAYRDAYRVAYAEVQASTQQTISAIRCGDAYQTAPADKRDAVLNRVFGPGGPCHYAPLAVSSVAGLLDAATRRSLASLQQAIVALPGYTNQVEEALLALVAPPPPKEKLFEWRPVAPLAGRRLAQERDVDEVVQDLSRTLADTADALKARIREGYIVVIK